MVLEQQGLPPEPCVLRVHSTWKTTQWAPPPKANPNAFPSIKYSPVGIASTIRPLPYMNLIQQNNVYLSSVATIAVAGIPAHTPNLDIPINWASELSKTQRLCQILMAIKWCMQICVAQMPGRILLISTKSNLDQDCQWLDDNLLPLFTTFIQSSPQI